jgi:hypothetical protein
VDSSNNSHYVQTSPQRPSLKTPTLAVVIVALVYVLVVLPARSQFRSRQWIESQRGRVAFSPNYRDEGGWYVAAGSFSLPKPLVDTVGIDYFASVNSVVLDCEEIYDLSGLRGLNGLENLYINQYVHDFKSLEILQDLPRLKTLTLSKWADLSRDELEALAKTLNGVDVVLE